MKNPWDKREPESQERDPNSAKPIVPRPPTKPRRCGRSVLQSSRSFPPCPLKKYDARGDRNVERGDLSRHRDAQQHVAMLAHLLVEPLALAAQDERRGLLVIHAVVIPVAALIEAVQVEPAFLQIFKRPVDIGDARHRKVLQRAGSGF